MTESTDKGDSRKLSTAAALLGKAQSTNFPAEQESLALGAYSQLAAFLNSRDPAEEATGGRRERRLLADRRRPAPEPEPDPEVIDLRADRMKSLYRQPDRLPRGDRIDLVL